MRINRAFRSYNSQSLLPATPANVQPASNLPRGVLPDGGTDHEAALLHALRLRPDAIFLLTDEEPAISDAQLAHIRQANLQGTIINTVEF